MEALIQIFRMDELTIEARKRAIKKLAAAIEREYASNFTDEIVEELCSLLDHSQMLMAQAEGDSLVERLLGTKNILEVEGLIPSRDAVDHAIHELKALNQYVSHMEGTLEHLHEHERHVWGRVTSIMKDFGTGILRREIKA